MAETSTPAAPPPEVAIARRERWILAALVLVALAPFAVAELFWDDRLVIRHDGPIAHLATLRTALTGRCVLFGPEYNYPYYRPIVDIAFILEYALVGTRPFLYHATNFVLHLMNVLMCYTIVSRVAGKDLPRGAAFFAAGFFALHPVQVESVLWPAARPAVISLFFFQLGVMSFLNLCERTRTAALWAVGAVIGFVGSLLCKESAIALAPAALPLFLARDLRVPRRAVVGAIAVHVALVTYLVANSAIASHAGTGATGGLSGLASTIAGSFGFYVGLLALPVSLVPSYIPGAHLETSRIVLGSVALLAVGVVAMWALVRRTRWSLMVFCGLGLFTGSALIPCLGGQLTLADRYLYQSLWGLSFAIAIAVSRVSIPESARVRVAQVALIVLALLSLRQATLWTREDVLWTRALELEPTNTIANLNLGRRLEKLGATDRALEHYRAAYATKERFPRREPFDAAVAEGHLTFREDRFDEARAAYAKAREWPELYAEALVYGAIVEYSAGDKAAGRALIAQFPENARGPLSMYGNLARISVLFEGDRKKAREWYDLGIARGMLRNEVIEEEIAAPLP